jgi:valyl-tRNA synthetase
LPRRATEKAPSICVAKYPTDTTARDEAHEANVSIVQGVINTCRSMKAEYKLTSKVSPEVYLKPAADASGVATMLAEIKTLAKVNATVLAAGAAPPAGCGVSSYGGTEVHMLIKGLVDSAAEIAKLEKELTKVTTTVADEDRFLASSNATKMADDALAVRTAKLTENKEKIETITKAIAMFKSL